MINTQHWTARSKINLGLEVLYKRPDGYHELQTIFYRVSEPHDVIAVQPSEVFRFTCSDPTLPNGIGNLMLSAAERFSALTLQPLPPIYVHLEKRIPIGAGLGGGSSDAATMLRILIAHMQVEVTAQEITNLCELLGADVPFFYSGHDAALGRGIGGRLTPISHLLNASVLIIKDPGVFVSTKEAYEGLALRPMMKPVDLKNALLCATDTREFGRIFRNDFEESVFEKYPSIARIKRELYDSGATFALMSGSGSSVFGLFEDTDVAREVQQVFLNRGFQAFFS